MNDTCLSPPLGEGLPAPLGGGFRNFSNQLTYETVVAPQAAAAPSLGSMPWCRRSHHHSCWAACSMFRATVHCVHTFVLRQTLCHSLLVFSTQVSTLPTDLRKCLNHTGRSSLWRLPPNVCAHSPLAEADSPFTACRSHRRRPHEKPELVGSDPMHIN